MKTTSFLITVLLATATNVYAFNDDPTELFSTNNNFTESSSIRWTPVDNVQKTCDAESKKRGYGGISWAIKACSFYNGSKCDIYTAKRVNMHTLGHEVRHCFQADWHK